MLRGEADVETLVEAMNEYLEKKVTSDDLRHLIGVLNSERVPSLAPESAMQKRINGISLNAHAPAFTPGSMTKGPPPEHDGIVSKDMMEFLESHAQDPDVDPLELLSNFCPTMDLQELEEIYKDHHENFGWTLNVLLAMQDGGEADLDEKEKETHPPPSAPPLSLDWSEEAFPELPGQKTVTHNAAPNGKTSFLDIAKKRRPPAEKPLPRSPPEASHGVRQRKENVEDPGVTIPWVVTGDAVSKQYAELRAAASRYAKLRNACFCEVS